MSKEFIQKRGLCYRKFTLLDDKISIKTKTYSKIKQCDIELDRIEYSISYEADNVFWGKIFLVITTIIPIVFIFVNFAIEPIAPLFLICSLFWGLSLMNILKQHKDDINLGYIEFYRNKPDEQAVLNFIDEIIKASKKYTKEKYLVLEDYQDMGQYHEMLIQMRARKIISNKEFNSLLEEYKRKDLLNL